MNILHTEFFPAELETDTLYVSEEYSTTAHLCASGCGFRVVLPLGKGYWRLVDEEHVTLSPSVHVPSCNSHYFIEAGGIRWAKVMTAERAKSYAAMDQREHNNEIQHHSLLRRLDAWLHKLFR